MKEFKNKAHNLYSIQRRQETIETSVTQILPLLVDKEKQLYIAANKGSIKELCRVMVINNRSYTDILKKDDYEQTIVHSICQMGHNQLFLFLRSILPAKSFVEFLYSPSWFNAGALELAARYAHVAVVKNGFDMKEVRDLYNNNDKLDMFFRLFYFLFPYDENLDLIDYILNLFNISKDLLNKIARHQCATPKRKFACDAHVYHRYTLLARITRWATFAVLKKFASIVGDKNFSEIVFLNEDWNQNAFECAVKSDRTKMIEYMLSFDAIKAEYCKNDDLLFRLSYYMFVHGSDISMIEFVMSELPIPVSKLQSFVTYQCSPATKTFGEGHYKYDQYSLIGEIVSKGKLENLKKLFSLIEKDAFVNGVFFKDKSGCNALDGAIAKGNLDVMRFLLEIKEIKNKCVDDLSELFKLVSGLNKYWNEAMARYIMNQLDVTGKKK
eukprot:149067_1